MSLKIQKTTEPTAIERRRITSPEDDLLYRELTESVFRDPPVGRRAIVVAVTAPAPRAGSTYVVTSLVNAIGARGGRTLVISARALRLAMFDVENDFDLYFDETEIPGVFEVRPELAAVSSGRDDDWSSRLRLGAGAGGTAEVLRRLGAHFDSIVVDCDAISESSDIAAVARWCKGVILVVEADHTRLDEIERARMMVERVGGQLLGCVLNKRKYPIPRWLYRLLGL